MLDNIKKYWFLYIALGSAAVWIATINSKTFDSPEQKVIVIKAVESMPTEADRAVEVANNKHAIEIRQMRYDDNKKNDAIKAIHDKKQDSLTLDVFKRFTVQIEQIKQYIKFKDTL